MVVRAGSTPFDLHKRRVRRSTIARLLGVSAELRRSTSPDTVATTIKLTRRRAKRPGLNRSDRSREVTSVFPVPVAGMVFWLFIYACLVLNFITTILDASLAPDR